MIKSVKEIKKLISKAMIPGYSFNTNFSSAEFLVDINNSLVIAADLVKKDNKMVYEFVLDTEFTRYAKVSYDEIVMVNNIIDILEENRKFVLSKLKKYTVEEYDEEERLKNERSEQMLEAFKYSIMKHMMIGDDKNE